MPKIKNIDAVKYDLRVSEFPDKHFQSGRQIGLIAQNVEKEFPELVNKDKDGYESLAYDKFTAVLLEAIKEQQKQIEGLKAEVAKLKGSKQ